MSDATNEWPQDPEACALLDTFLPGLRALVGLRGRYLQGELGPAQSIVQGTLRPPQEGDLTTIAANAVPELTSLGAASIRDGRVGLAILNGGMATRFGGVVKGAVALGGGRSFLGLKLLDAQRTARRLGAREPLIVLMNSRATQAATLSHLAEKAHFGYPPDRILCVEQTWTARLTPEGELFRDEDGALSLYGMGHGDLGPVLRASGVLDRFHAEGGDTLLMSNVDNAVATLDPALLGQHLRGGADVTVELVRKWAGDAGGAPAWVDGKMQIVEGFRFPPTFDATTIPVFNTNTFWFRSQALAAETPLPFHAVRKEVGGRPVLQFERLVGEVTAHLSAQWLMVSREGADSRFVPIKSPADLEAARERLLETWAARGLA